MSKYPQYGEHDFESLYEERVELIADVERIIEKVLPTRTVDGYDIVEFTSITSGDPVLAAFNESPRPAITLFLAVTGVSTGDVETQLGFNDTYSIADNWTQLPHKNPRAQKLAPYLAEKLTEDLLVETVIQQTVYRWTLDHRRHHRKDFEKHVQSFLEKKGIPLLPDTQVEGSPDIAVPHNNDEMAIVGEIRTSNKQDWGTRISEFYSEIRDLALLHPDAEIVVVMQFPEEITSERFERIKQGFDENVGDQLTRLYTADELSNFGCGLSKMGVTTPTTNSSVLNAVINDVIV